MRAARPALERTMSSNFARPCRRVLTATLLLSIASCDQLGCDGGRDISYGPAPPVKSAAYAEDDVRAWVGVPIDPVSATIRNFVPVRFLVSPALALGLSVDDLTGTLSGTPDTPSARVEHVVYVYENASDVGAAAELAVEVFAPVAPSDLVYDPPAATVAQGAALVPMTPTYVGGVQEFTVAPPLPSGLTLDAWTGRVTGVCTAPLGTTQHTISATNPFGSDETTIEIEVVEGLGVRGYAVVGVGELTVDLYAGRTEGAAPIDTLDGNGAAGVAAVGTHDGRFVFVALTDGNLYRAAYDRRTGRAGELVQVAQAAAARSLHVTSDGAHLLVVSASTITRYDLAFDGALCCAVELSTTIAPTAALLVSEDVLVLGSSSPGRIAVFDVQPALQSRGAIVELGAEVYIDGFEPFDEQGMFYAATSTYDVNAHTFVGTVRRLNVASASAGQPGVLLLQAVTVGGDLTDLEFVESTAVGGTLYVTDGSQGRIHRISVGEFGALLTSQIGSTTVGVRPVAIAPGLRAGHVAVIDETREELTLYDVSTGGAPLALHVTRTRRQPVALAPLVGVVIASTPLVADDVFIVSAADSTLRAARTQPAAPAELVLSPQLPVATGARPVAVVASDEAPFVFTANRDDASISVFRYDAATMALTPVETEALSPGSQPVSLALSPSGRHLVVIDEVGRAIGFAVSQTEGSLTAAGSQALTGDLSEASVRSDAHGRYFYVAQPNAGRISVLVLGLPAGFPVFQGTEASLFAPSDVWLPYDGRFAYALDRELGRAAAFTVDTSDGGLTPLGAALTLPGAPARAVTDLGVETMSNGITPAFVVFDPQGERAIPVARSGSSGVVVGAQPSGPTATLPAEATAIATLSRATTAEGATLVVTYDDGARSFVTGFALASGGAAWVQGSSLEIGRGPHALATRASVR